MRKLWMVACLFAACASWIFANSQAPAASNVRIVQLSLVNGGVEIQLPDGHGWRPALLDAPVTAGEQVRVDAGGRAEIQFEDGSAVRLIPGSELSVDTLQLQAGGVRTSVLTLAKGTAFVSLYNKADAQDFHLKIPSGEVTAADKAIYRVDLDGNGGANVAVFNGRARVQYGATAYELKDANTIAIGAGANARVETARDDAPVDSYTEWSRDRDQWYQAALANPAAAPGMGVNAYQNWYGANNTLGTIPPMYYAGPLMYTGMDDCPWTLGMGMGFMTGIPMLPGMDYSPWCWNPDLGWFMPVGGLLYYPLVTSVPVTTVGGTTTANPFLRHVPVVPGQNPNTPLRNGLPQPTMVRSLQFRNNVQLYGFTEAQHVAMLYRGSTEQRNSPMAYAYQTGMARDWRSGGAPAATLRSQFNLNSGAVRSGDEIRSGVVAGGNRPSGFTGGGNAGGDARGGDGNFGGDARGGGGNFGGGAPAAAGAGAAGAARGGRG